MLLLCGIIQNIYIIVARHVHIAVQHYNGLNWFRSLAISRNLDDVGHAEV